MNFTLTRYAELNHQERAILRSAGITAENFAAMLQQAAAALERNAREDAFVRASNVPGRGRSFCRYTVTRASMPFLPRLTYQTYRRELAVA